MTTSKIGSKTVFKALDSCNTRRKLCISCFPFLRNDYGPYSRGSPHQSTTQVSDLGITLQEMEK